MLLASCGKAVGRWCWQVINYMLLALKAGRASQAQRWRVAIVSNRTNRLIVSIYLLASFYVYYPALIYALS